jgi:two-component system, NtrC family, response regulator AtoC
MPLPSPTDQESGPKILPKTLIEDRQGGGAGGSTRLWLTVFEQSGSKMLPVPEAGELKIGRSEECHIVLSSPSVSRVHATLTVRNGEVLIKDLDSANGTRLGTNRLVAGREEAVPPGVAVIIGGASLVVHALPSDSAHSGRTGISEVREIAMAGEHIQALRASEKGAAEAKAPATKLVVQSESMQKLFQLVDRIAPGTISVLLVGETGVGKEVVASAIHERSPRRHRPYVKLNCSAFPENLLESELFGYEAGAFSGARSGKLGLFETANRGTVLLDEIGEMPMSIQAKLLRVIETCEVLPVGGTRVRKLDVRFLAATNRDLQHRIRKGQFREDLYFRLSGVVVEVPPLRMRRSEIAPMAMQFAIEGAAALGKVAPPSFTPEALRFLEKQAWPGNVRELRNCISRAVLLSTSENVTEADVNPRSVSFGSERQVKTMELPLEGSNRSDDSSLSAEREQIEEALAACGGNQTRAAAVLGIARRTLVKKIATLGVPRPRR